MNSTEFLKKYQPVLEEMVQEVGRENISYLMLNAYSDYGIAMADGSNLTIYKGTSRISEANNSTCYYEGIGPEQGTIVTEDEAYPYALERCLKGTESDRREFKEMLVEWFYSGNWKRREEGHVEAI